jgi:hypothetical protein
MITVSAPSDELPGRTRARPWRAAGSLLVVAVAAVGLLPDLFGLDRRSPFAQLVAFRPTLLAGMVLVTGLAAGVARWRRRGWLLPAGLALVTAAGAGLVVPRALPDDIAAPVAGRTVTVLAFNTFEGRADVDAVAALVRDTRPDLVALVEAGPRYRDRLAPLLGPDYRPDGSDSSRRDVQGVSVLTHADLGAVAVQVREDTPFPSVEVTGGGLGGLRFVAFHAVAPTPGSVPQWRSDLATLGRWCANRDVGPAVVAGDFNATLDHAVFRDATQGCVDAAAQTGRGLVGTWNSRLPRWLGAQIDHVLLTGGVSALDSSVVDVPGSDHRAVLTRLRLPG